MVSRKHQNVGKKADQIAISRDIKQLSRYQDAFYFLARHSLYLLCHPVNDPEHRQHLNERSDDMPSVEINHYQDGDFLVNYEEKVFEDVKAEPGEKALLTFHTIAFEGSIGLVNMLQAKRLLRKGFETKVLLYGPGVQLGVQRGFPTLGAEAFPGHLAVNNQIKAFMAEGGEVYACRFALQALYGQTEKALIEGIRPINPLDVMDLRLLMRREGAMIIDTWTA